MLFVVRDDDVSFFTRPAELEAAYGDLWATVPISLAVIPFDVPTSGRGVPDAFHQEGEPVSLEGNAPLVGRLRELVQQGRVEIMLHGYSHLYQRLSDGPFSRASRVPEFIYTEEKERKLREGRALLERLLGAPVRVFVPPSNAISRDGLRALRAVGLDQACLTDRRELLAAHPANLAAALLARLSPRFPYSVRRYATHRELLCHPLTPSCDWVGTREHLRRCGRRGGIFVVATHYWEQDRLHPSTGRPLRELLRELIAEARTRPTRFVRMSEAFGRNGGGASGRDAGGVIGRDANGAIGRDANGAIGRDAGGAIGRDAGGASARPGSGAG